MCRVHGFFGESGRGVFNKRHVIAQFHRKTAGRLDAGVGKEANDNHAADAVLLQLLIEIGVCKTALSPVLADNNVPRLGSKLGVPFSALSVVG